MTINTRRRNKDAHPGYVDLPEKRGREYGEDLGESEPRNNSSDSPRSKKPPKRQKPTTEKDQQLYNLAVLQTKLTKAALKDATEAVRPPGPQIAKVPRKPSAEPTRSQLVHHGKSRQV